MQTISLSIAACNARFFFFWWARKTTRMWIFPLEKVDASTCYKLWLGVSKLVLKIPHNVMHQVWELLLLLSLLQKFQTKCQSEWRNAATINKSLESATHSCAHSHQTITKYTYTQHAHMHAGAPTMTYMLQTESPERERERRGEGRGEDERHKEGYRGIFCEIKFKIPHTV